MILTIRTDKPEAEIGLFDHKGKQLNYHTWLAHRELEATLLKKIDSLLGENKTKLKGIVVFAGPGSFTGLRIGVTVANAMAYALNIPVIATGSDQWITTGIKRLPSIKADSYAVPEYGQEPHTTTPKRIKP